MMLVKANASTKFLNLKLLSNLGISSSSTKCQCEIWGNRDVFSSIVMGGESRLHAVHFSELSDVIITNPPNRCAEILHNSTRGLFAK